MKGRASQWFLTIAAALSAGCQDELCPTVAPADLTLYKGCLRKYETVTEATQVGPFTTLTIRYVEPGGYVFGVQYTFRGIAYKGRILVRDGNAIQKWAGLSRPAFFVDFPHAGRSSSEHIIYEKDGQPVIESLDPGGDGYSGSVDFPFGYPTRHDIRYFPNDWPGRNAGFLLRMFPARITRLPLGPQGVGAPWVQSLAGVAPDGTAYAYTDSYSTPSAVAVVAADGTVHDPIPIPFTRLALSDRLGANPFHPVWRWFNESFTWQKDGHGQWRVSPKLRHPFIRTSHPVEELFIDAATGYLKCFDSANSACIRGWQSRPDFETKIEACCHSPYVYSPTSTLQAFDAKIVALVHAKSLISGSGYQMLLDGSRDRVITSLSERLKNRRIPFVRVDQCADEKCLNRLKEIMTWENDRNDEPIRRLLRTSEEIVVFVTPTVAVAVHIAPNGQTWLNTLTRYSPRSSPGSKGESPTRFETAH